MRIDCGAKPPQGIDAPEHRCMLEPGHAEDFHLCEGCRYSWPNTAPRLSDTGVTT